MLSSPLFLLVIPRAQFGVLEAGNKKYASFAALGWVGVLAVFAGVLGEPSRLPKTSKELLALIALLIFLPVSVAGYERETRIWQWFSDRNWEFAAAALLRINQLEALESIYFLPPFPHGGVAHYVDLLGPTGRELFAQFPYRWGTDGKAVLDRMVETTCKGSVQYVNGVPMAERVQEFDAAGNPATIGGWTWIDQDRAPADTIIAVGLCE